MPKHKKILTPLICFSLVIFLTGCSEKETSKNAVTGSAVSGEAAETEEQTVETPLMMTVNDLPENRPDDKYRSCYDGDGIGDIEGVTQKLDYISELGFDAIWLMPVMPSPSYHKYDITDYEDIDPEYGSIQDFEDLVVRSHELGINIYIDLVLNHSSSEHPWFSAALDYIRTLEKDEEPDLSVCPYVDYYNFSKESKSGYTRVEEAASEWYYEAQFTDTMPDFNLKSPTLRSEFEEIVDFWLGQGVDGFRMDATTYYDSASKDSSIEILKWIADYIYAEKSDAYIVGEAFTDLATYATAFLTSDSAIRTESRSR